MKVSEVMHRGAVCLDDDTPLREVARAMREEDIGAIPISAAGELVGLVTQREHRRNDGAGRDVGEPRLLRGRR